MKRSSVIKKFRGTRSPPPPSQADQNIAVCQEDRNRALVCFKKKLGEELGAAVEQEVFNNESKATYAGRCRELLFSVSNNTVIQPMLESGELSVQTFCSMSNDDLAPKEIREQRMRNQEAAFKDRTLPSENDTTLNAVKGSDSQSRSFTESQPTLFQASHIVLPHGITRLMEPDNADDYRERE
eukprot:gb/GEZN01009266.1/.p1 GENE.gb/GEZN01009266.1/~~gb/GEZN01009266.1/.p1  ORF type:complete len:183 (-),score=16.29 gb/GEZN01009266.1/:400-948(-)